MLGKFQIISERWEEFDSKKGKQRVRRLALLDQTQPALLNTLDYEPKGDDVTKLPDGACVGKIVELGITGFQVGFGGRMNVQGKVIANGSPAEAPKVPSR